MCFPEKWVIDVLIPTTNKELDSPINLQEFYVFLGCIFFQASFKGISNHDQWWSTKAINMFEGMPHRLNNFMSRNRFKEIMQALRYTDRPQPEYLDRFHDIRQMQDEWNAHMETAYFTGWFNCLDESMNSWLNKFCLGFMSLPRKPHPFGNEYHSIADGDGGPSRLWAAIALALGFIYREIRVRDLGKILFDLAQRLFDIGGVHLIGFLVALQQPP